jgi:hypothetical protein
MLAASRSGYPQEDQDQGGVVLVRVSGVGRGFTRRATICGEVLYKSSLTPSTALRHTFRQAVVASETSGDKRLVGSYVDADNATIVMKAALANTSDRVAVPTISSVVT